MYAGRYTTGMPPDCLCLHTPYCTLSKPTRACPAIFCLYRILASRRCFLAIMSYTPKSRLLEQPTASSLRRCQQCASPVFPKSAQKVHNTAARLPRSRSKPLVNTISLLTTQKIIPSRLRLRQDPRPRSKTTQTQYMTAIQKKKSYSSRQASPSNSC